MKFNVTDIEFDFDDDLLDEITTATGWCIKNIYYDIQLK